MTKKEFLKLPMDERRAILEECCTPEIVAHYGGLATGGHAISENKCSAIGELVVWEEEGGYCTPAIRLKTTDGEVSLDEMVEKLIPGIEMGGGKKGIIIEVNMRVISPTTPGEQVE